MYHKIGVVLTSFADVFRAFIPRPPTSALRSMKFLSWKPTNHSQLPIFWKVAFDLYDLRENVSIDMADIEVGRAGNSRNPSSSWLVDIFSYRLIPSTTFGFRYRSWNCWSHGTVGHIVLVVSPLVSLMEDQVDKLRKRRISAVFLSDIKDEDTKEVEEGFSL